MVDGLISEIADACSRIIPPGCAFRRKSLSGCRVFLCLLAAGGAGTALPAQRPNSRQFPVLPATIARRWDTAQWDTVWIRGGTVNDTMFAAPFAIAAGPGVVYVADAARQQVIALDAHNGDVRWRFGRGTKGLDPITPLSNPNSLVPLASGDLLIGDTRLRRLFIVNPDGQLRRSVALKSSIGQLHSLCELTPDRWALAILERGNPLVIVDPQGNILARRPSPFPVDVRGMIANQARFAQTSDVGACALAQQLGESFSWLGPSGSGASHPYLVRSPAFDSLSFAGAAQARLPQTAYSMVASSTELWIATSNPNADSLNVIDRYARPSGRYMGSLHVPRNITAFALMGDVIYVIHGIDGHPAVSALRMRILRR